MFCFFICIVALPSTRAQDVPPALGLHKSVASMEKSEAKGYFTKVKNVTLAMLKDPSAQPVMLVLAFDSAIKGEPRVVHRLPITEIATVEPDGVRYMARLEQEEEVGLTRRLIVALIERTIFLETLEMGAEEPGAPLCPGENTPPLILWDARVIDGYGMCGAQDARMALSGSPRTVD